MFRIAVCDDDCFFAEKLKGLISAYLKENRFKFEIDTYHAGEALLELGIGAVQYSAIFLDIHMEKMDGITVAKKIREVSKEVPIVFVTEHANYLLEGYRFSIIRYLLKNNADFKDNLRECMDAVMDKVGCSVEKRKFNFQEGAKEVLLDRLLYIESKLHKLEFHVMEGSMKVYTLYGTLNTLEASLPEHSFVRIHQSYLVNLKHIRDVARYKVILENEDELAVPKVRYPYVREKYITYQGEVL